MIIEGLFQKNYSVLFYCNIPYISVTWISFAILLSHHSASGGPSEAIQLILILNSFEIAYLQTPAQPFFPSLFYDSTSRVLCKPCVMWTGLSTDCCRSPKTVFLHCKNLAYIPTLCFLSFSHLFILSVRYY